MNHWTTICYDVSEGKYKPYVRIVPDFMENAGWGLSMHKFHETEESAQAEANEIENFMDHVIQSFIDTLADDVLSVTDIQKIKSHIISMRGGV